MPIVNGYASLAELKTRLDISDTAEDTLLETLLTATSREIDDYCRRRFYAATETRYYTADQADVVLVDDCLSVSALLTDADGDRTYETTWTTADYDLDPPNAALDGEPYWQLSVTPRGNYSFPRGVARGVKVTGSWGYSASTPAVINNACLYQAALAWRAVDAPGGMSGGGEFRTEITAIGLHPFTKRLLMPYRRLRAR